MQKTKKGNLFLASTPVVVLSTILGRTPSIEEYKTAVKGIDLTKFAPPTESLRARQSVKSYMNFIYLKSNKKATPEGLRESL